MKKFVTMLTSGMLALVLLFGAGNAVFAHEGDAGCGCEVEEITGLEKIKEVASLIISKEFIKVTLTDAKKAGHYWSVLDKIDVTYNKTYDIMMIGVPFKDKQGNVFIYGFFNGKFVGVVPAEDAEHSH